MWLLTGIFTRFPELKIVFVEPGLGWVAGYLSFLDDMVLRQGYEFPVLGGRAAELLLPPQHGDDVHRRARSRCGTCVTCSVRENLMWSSDYPHPVSTWPKSLAVIDELFEGVPDAERDLMVEHNAARIWNL